MRHFLISIGLMLLLCGSVIAAPSFPALTGRVVDNAHILSPTIHHQLEKTLTDYEKNTSNQIIVVTLQSLNDLTIEEYGIALARYWQIGQKDKNNGVLLIVAPKDRQVRIEVGYGLEGVLTDALSHQIIQQIILPNFKSGKIQKGIIEGIDAILSVLGGEGIPADLSHTSFSPWQLILFALGFLVFLWLAIRHPVILWILFSSLRSGNGKFKGGGGNFGGGGSSGKW